MTKFSTLLVCVYYLLKEISGHGMMMDPPSRSSLWRIDKRAPVNYNDNELYCGGFGTQWVKFGGKCGVCGDVYDAPHPQPNENTGKYGVGIVSKTYQAGSTIEVRVDLSATHLGHFSYSLCELKDPKAPESGEECFQPLKLADGSSQYKIALEEFKVRNQVQLPNVKCERCVLRWEYVTGNSWGKCEDGSYQMGCGPQETFRNCADISIA